MRKMKGSVEQLRYSPVEKHFQERLFRPERSDGFSFLGVAQTP
jgi:hypothetical protein